MAVSVTASELRVVQAFSDLPEDDLAYLAGIATRRTLAPGETLFREGAAATLMFAVLAGEIRARRESGASDGRLFIRGAGQIGGMLPHSRVREFPVTARAVVPSTVACFEASDFPRLLARVPVLESRLASTMADRVREAAQYDQQRDTLSSLGKLAAGLAHEINNPTGAIQRSTAELGRRTEQLGGALREVLAELVPAEALEGVTALIDRAGGDEAGDPLERSAVEDALALWLERAGVDEPWARASDLVAAGVGAIALEEATRGMPASVRRACVRWIDAQISARQLVREVGAAAARVADLVGAVKAFSHLDRAPEAAPVDVRDGIAATVVVLGHRLRSKGVHLEVHHADDLPLVLGSAGELNQVWANLLDNAIDAVAEEGHVEIRTGAVGGDVVVAVSDDGPGIPDEIRWRIFEPFFTTKGVGQGTGLGLDLVQRIVRAHRGEVVVRSEPRSTRFEVRLPSGGAQEG